jgi:hypothetical protein
MNKDIINSKKDDDNLDRSEKRYNIFKDCKEGIFKDYKEEADFLNSITYFGKPIFKVSPEYLSIKDELCGFSNRKKLSDMIGKLPEENMKKTERQTLYIPLSDVPK